MKTNNNTPPSPSLWDKIRYWSDHHLTNTTRSMIITLTIFTFFITIILSIILLCFEEVEVFPAFWDTFSTTINA